MLKKFAATLVLCCTFIVLLTGCGAPSGPNPVHMNGNSFAQSSITIKKGASVTLMNDSLVDSHTIANGTWTNGKVQSVKEAGAPTINNIQVGGNSSATIGPFTTAGTFHLYCTVHVGMNLTVIVQ